MFVQFRVTVFFFSASLPLLLCLLDLQAEAVEAGGGISSALKKTLKIF